MLAKQGIISEQDCEDILNGLASIADDLASGKLEIDPTPRTSTPSALFQFRLWHFACLCKYFIIYANFMQF